MRSSRGVQTAGDKTGGTGTAVSTGEGRPQRRGRRTSLCSSGEQSRANWRESATTNVSWKGASSPRSGECPPQVATWRSWSWAVCPC